MAKGDKLRELINESGYKPYILSEKLGHNKSCVYHWINGRYEPCARDMVKLSKLLNVPVERIVMIFGEDENGKG